MEDRYPTEFYIDLRTIKVNERLKKYCNFIGFAMGIHAAINFYHFFLIINNNKQHIPKYILKKNNQLKLLSTHKVSVSQIYTENNWRVFFCK